MTAYYNEFDPFAADVLENLILCGVIPAGHVDRRSIEDVQPSDLKGFTQCHFFAGFGVWPYAMRQAGWSDDRPAWTGSCPCPPFSSAGKKKACPECGGQRPVPHVGRTGYFVCCLCGHQWLADGRHLWPEFWRLIRDERPAVVFGEQVAGADGLVWIDLVRASLEVLAYAAGAADLCAAGVGAPHIRQRGYWVAHTDSYGAGHDTGNGLGAQTALDERDRGIPRERLRVGVESSSGRLADDQMQQRSIFPRGDYDPAERRKEPTAPAGLRRVERLDDTNGRDACAQWEQRGREHGQQQQSDGRDGDENRATRPTDGFWRDADWLGCRDERWRPVEPGTFPLVNGAPNRVGALRGYGNAIVAPLAQAFVETVMEYLGDE